MDVVRIVIADDHPLIRYALKATLAQEEGFEVVGEASDGLSALQLTRQLEPDVVLMDASMPGLGGIEATRRICSGRSRAAVIGLSRHDDQETIFGMLDAGAKAFVAKKGEMEELFGAIRSVVAGNHYLGQNLSGMLIQNYLALKRQRRAENPLDLLSAREREIVKLLVEGQRPSAIAERLGISVRTVESHRSRAMSKIGVSHLPALVRWAIKHGLVDEEL